MLDISDYQQEKVEISFKSKLGEFAFSVRGLSLGDITRLVTLHLEDLEQAKLLFERFKLDIFTKKSAEKLLIALINSAPGLCAEIISLAADRPDDTKLFARLPMIKTLESLAEIWRMTVEDIGGLDPLKASLGTVLPTVIPAHILAALKDGVMSLFSIGASEKTQVSSENKDTVTPSE